MEMYSCHFLTWYPQYRHYITPCEGTAYCSHISTSSGPSHMPVSHLGYSCSCQHACYFVSRLQLGVVACINPEVLSANNIFFDKVCRYTIIGNQNILSNHLSVFLAVQMQASVQNDSRYHEDSLHTATFKLTDFGRAVPFKDVLPGIPSGTTSPSEPQLGPQRYNQDGIVVLSDPTYQPPEVCFADPHASCKRYA